MVEWSSLLNNKTAVFAVAATAAAVVAASVFLSKRKRMEFELVGEVTALNCYPIKSCKGIAADEALCTRNGIQVLNVKDRHFMIVRPNGDFITQRQISKMAGVVTQSDGQDLILNADGMPELRVPLNPKLDRSKVVPCRVWQSRMEAQDCGPQAGAWLSKYLEEDGLRLLTLPQGLTKRQCPTANATTKDQVAFPDKCPYHLAVEESLADLNARIGKKPEGEITMKNFRPNIVIKGAKQPWDEDNWSYVKIGTKFVLRVMAPCDRCVLTTVDPQKKLRRKDEEPLKTLKTFRLFPESSNSPMFGLFSAAENENTIKVGDPVYAVRK